MKHLSETLGMIVIVVINGICDFNTAIDQFLMLLCLEFFENIQHILLCNHFKIISCGARDLT